MTPLPESFKKAGFDYRQIRRVGLTAIYHQTKDGRHRSYEVGRIRQNAARFAFGKEFNAAESWPSAEEWGIRAWTYPDLGRAERRLATLTP